MTTVTQPGQKRTTPDDDRQATKPLWERYGLFSLSGNVVSVEPRCPSNRQ